MRNGKLFEVLKKFRIVGSRLSEASQEGIKMLEEAAGEFPYRDPKVDGDPIQELLKLCRDRHMWFMEWFGVGEEQ